MPLAGGYGEYNSGVEDNLGSTLGVLDDNFLDDSINEFNGDSDDNGYERVGGADAYGYALNNNIRGIGPRFGDAGFFENFIGNKNPYVTGNGNVYGVTNEYQMQDLLANMMNPGGPLLSIDNARLKNLQSGNSALYSSFGPFSNVLSPMDELLLQQLPDSNGGAPPSMPAAQGLPFQGATSNVQAQNPLADDPTGMLMMQAAPGVDQSLQLSNRSITGRARL